MKTFSSQSNFSIIKVIICATIGILTIIFSSGKKEKSKKKKSLYSKIKRNYNITNSVIDRIYLNKLKDEIKDDGFPVKLENAEIIDI